MDFALTDEQEMFRGYIRKALDNAGQTMVARDAIQNNVGSLNKTTDKLSELGCTSINIPEEFGGLGLSALDLVPTFEELGRSLFPGLLLETMALAVPLLYKYGTEEQKKKYLPKIAAGQKKISFAVMEPERDFSPEGIQTMLQANGDSYILDDTKILVPDGEYADTYLVLVRSKSGVGSDGLTLLLVDQAPALRIERQVCIDETKHLTKLTFDRYELEEEQILGDLHGGWSVLEEGLLYFNAALSSNMVGSMESIIESATEYAKIREQFGQPIGRFQAIKHKIVDMKVQLETARSLSYYANWVLETSEPDREAAVYSARSYATEAFINVASENIQIHGGIGFTEEIDCHLFLKRAHYYAHYLGDTTYYQENVVQSLGW